MILRKIIFNSFIVVHFWKITGNRKTASPFPLQYTSKAGFPLQISTGVRCRYVFPMRYKNTANGYCLRLSTAFEYVLHRKSTTNPRTMQIIREKNAKFLEIYPDFGGEGNLFPLSLYMKWNEIYRDIIYIYFLYVMQKQCICIKNLCICIEIWCICIANGAEEYICIAFGMHLECICIEKRWICIK